MSLGETAGAMHFGLAEIVEIVQVSSGNSHRYLCRDPQLDSPKGPMTSRILLFQKVLFCGFLPFQRIGFLPRLQAPLLSASRIVLFPRFFPRSNFAFPSPGAGFPDSSSRPSALVRHMFSSGNPNQRVSPYNTAAHFPGTHPRAVGARRAASGAPARGCWGATRASGRSWVLWAWRRRRFWAPRLRAVRVLGAGRPVFAFFPDHVAPDLQSVPFNRGACHGHW